MYICCHFIFQNIINNDTKCINTVDQGAISSLSQEKEFNSHTPAIT
mgnify:CR=1 FL=1